MIICCCTLSAQQKGLTLFSGKVEKYTGIVTTNMDMEIDGELISEENVSNFKQVLDMKTAAFTTSFQFRDKATISYTIYTLRSIQYTGYVDINVIPTKLLKLKMTGKITTPEEYRSIRTLLQVQVAVLFGFGGRDITKEGIV